MPVGKDIGFLPGTVNEKMEEWIRPFKNNIEYIRNLNSDKGKSKVAKEKIEMLMNLDACKEVMEVLPNLVKEDYDKIPKKFIEFLKENENPKYKKEFDFSKPLEELGLNKNSLLVLGVVYRMFLASSEEKEEFDRMLIENEMKEEKEKKIKFSPDNIFKKEQSFEENIDEIKNIEENKTDLTIKTNNWFNNLLDKIKKLFGKSGK